MRTSSNGSRSTSRSLLVVSATVTRTRWATIYLQGLLTNRMSHIAITNVLDGKMVEWLEQVTDSEYTAKDRA